MEKILELIKKIFEWLKKSKKNKIVFLILAIAVVSSSLVMTGCTSFRVDKASVEGLELIKNEK